MSFAPVRSGAERELQRNEFLDVYGPAKRKFLEVFMVNNLVFTWPEPLFFMVVGAHGLGNSYTPIISHDRMAAEPAQNTGNPCSEAPGFFALQSHEYQWNVTRMVAGVKCVGE